VLVVTCVSLGIGFGRVDAQRLDLEADEVTYDSAARSVVARGNVRLHWKESTLETQSLRVEQATRRIVAEGGLLLLTPELRLEASSCDLDVDDETGWLEDVEITVDDLSLTFGGEEVRKYPGSRYSLLRGYYTTCLVEDSKPPDWSLAGQRVDVDVGGYGVLRHASFRVRDVPVLYLPYVAFPAHRDRQSGILLPQLGASNKRGFVVRQPGFWAIDKHQDLTLTGVAETSARLGIGAGYRYRPSRNTHGEIEAAYYNERIRGDEESDIESPLFEGENIPENRWMLGARHRQKVRDHIEIYGDGLVVSDDLYLREIEPTHGDYIAESLRRSLRYTVNRGGVLARRGFSSLGARAIAYQDFVDDDKLTLQRPGEIWATMDGDIGGVGFVLGGEVTRFLRRRGADGTRLDANVTFSRDLTPRTPLMSNVWVRGRVDGYQMDERSVRDEDGNEIDELDDYTARAVADTGIDLRTSFKREFVLPQTRFADAIAGTRREDGTMENATMLHLLEPFTAVRFTTVGDEDQVPLYDELDRYDDRTTFTYGIAQRFLFRSDSDAQREERARVSIAQTYNLEQKVIDDHFSDVDLSLAVKPIGGVSVSSLTSYNPGASQLTGAVAELSVGELSVPYLVPRGASVDVVYRFVRGGETEIDADLDDLETLEGRALFALTSRVSFGINGRYDFPGSEFVESGGGFRITSACDCWAIDLGMINRVNPDETEVRVAIELKGLGGLGSSALDYQTPGLAGVQHGRTIYGRYGW
jgi:LPS-assembly protein